MKYNNDGVSLEDRIVRATLPFWWPVAFLVQIIFLYNLISSL